MSKRAQGSLAAIVAVFLLVSVGACAKKQPPVARPAPPPPSSPSTAGVKPPAPPQPVSEPPVVPPEPVPVDDLAMRSLDELNRDSPLGAAYFDYDSADLSADAQAQLTKNAAVLKQRPAWIVTIEGHCDERGTAEYNLALGERRAAAARTYLMSLGIGADRLKTVSYGKEFPFDPGKSEPAYAKNRRAHFVITAK